MAENNNKVIHLCRAGLNRWLGRIKARVALSALLTAGAVLVAGNVAAQTVESLSWVEGVTPPVARITFNASVRFLQQAPLSSTDLAQLSFQITAAEDAVMAQSVEEGKRLDSVGGKVGITMTYVPVPSAKTKVVTLRFSEKVQMAARQGPGARTIDLAFVGASFGEPAAPVQAPAPAASGSAVPSNPDTAAQVEDKAQAMLASGRLALTQQRWQDAVDSFNQLLLLPPNRFSEPAQEAIGTAWEGLKQLDKARIEYQLYLKLYPQGADAQRVAQRLEALGGGTVTPGATTIAGKVDSKADQTRVTSSGSISQYYYGGRSKTDSLVNISAGIDQSTLSRTNQSSLVTSVDASARYKSEGSETRVVLRDTYSKSFLTTTSAQGGLSAAYVDYRDLKSRLDLRFGRQSAIGGSLFGGFDGVSMAWPVTDKYKLDAMIGVPANALVSAPSQRLAGVMVEVDNLFEHFGGNVSLVDQTSEGISDRRALGLEVRYFGESLSMFSQLDYDLNFRVINAATLQGSMQGPYGTTITLLLDNRKAPSLQLSDALISAGTTSLKTLLQLKSLAEVKDIALGTAAQARQALFSLSRALSPKWQGSIDFRYSDIGALPAVGDFQAMPATGAQYNVSMQLTGSNLYSGRDINGVNVSILRSDQLRGTQVAYNNLTGFMDNKASFEPSIRFYSQTDAAGIKMLRVSPGVRLSYKLSDRSSLLGETIYERSSTDGPTNHEDSSAVFFYVGYRYDFF